MKKELKGFVIGMTAAALAMGSIAYAKTGSEMIEAAYNNVKIYVDGLLVDPKDGNGDTVEPFISNGTTYLPVRAVADALGKEVSWDQETSSVILGNRNYDWLDQMSFLDSERSNDENKFYAISDDTGMSDYNRYDRGLQFEIRTSSINSDDPDPYVNVSYLLGNQYESFEGIISSWNGGSYEQTSFIKIYGDDKLLYTSPIISHGMKSTDFKIDVSGVNILKLEATYYNPNSYKTLYPCIAEARLLKK